VGASVIDDGLSSGDAERLPAFVGEVAAVARSVFTRIPQQFLVVSTPPLPLVDPR
jgi:hypothetical protein